MKRQVGNWRKRCEQYECCSHQINLNTIVPPNPRSCPFILHLPLHHTPPPFISLSLYLSACLFPDKNPIWLFFEDWTAGRELDALVAKVMTAAIWSAHMHPAVAHTHSRTLAHSPVLPTLQTVHAFEWQAVWRHSKAMWATYYTLRATSNEILAQRWQIWHLKAVSSSEA